MAFFAIFCFKYLYADSLRMDYCKETEYYDKNAYNGFEMEYKVISSVTNGVAKSDSAVKQIPNETFCFGLPSADSTQFEYITTTGGYCRFKRVK